MRTNLNNQISSPISSIMIKTKIPPPLYMLVFAIVMWLLDKYMPIFHWASPHWQKAGWIIVALGVLIDLFSMGLFIRAGTSPNPFQPENASQLISTGLYRFTRNPMYLGLLVLLTGWAIHLGSFSPIVLLPLFVVTLTAFQIKPEEQALETIFGQEYIAYKTRVRRWI